VLLSLYTHFSRPFWTGQPLAYPVVQKSGAAAAKLWELRAVVSLARLRRDQGDRVAARDLIAPVFCRFTEGFAMPDLKEAKALLDEL
jgi:predicted ATPase